MLDVRQLLVACRFGSASKADLEAYILSVVEGGDEYDIRLFDAHAKDLKVARAKMIEFIGLSFPDFRIDTHEGLEICKAELNRQIGLLLTRMISPADFCHFFSSLEWELVIKRDLSSEEVGFLGDLFNACDWCDDTWTLENAPYLAQEAARLAFQAYKPEQGPVWLTQ